MPGWSRRQTLASLAGAATLALGGCRGDAGHSTSTGGGGRRSEDYEYEQVRDEDGAALFSAGTDGATARPPDADPGGTAYLTSEADLADRSFASTPEARTLREFAAETDFASESMFLVARTTPACEEFRFRGVRVDDSPSVAFCRTSRPADAECTAGVTHTVGVAVRLGFPGEEFSGYGSRVSGSCSRPRRPVPFEANVTLADEEDR